MVNVGTGTSGTRFISKDYPVEEGLEAGTEKQEGRISNLEAEEGSLVPRSQKIGIGV